MASYCIGTAFFGEKYLSHHGIKGMKWGIRRYQNPDGSLTAEGKRRYREIDDKYFSESNKRWTEKRQAADDKRLEKDLGGPDKADQIFQKMFPALVAEYDSGYAEYVNGFDEYKGKGKKKLYELADQVNKADRESYELWDRKYQDALKSAKENASFTQKLLLMVSQEANRKLENQAKRKATDEEFLSARKKVVDLENKYEKFSAEIAGRYKDQLAREVLADIPEESKDLVWYYIQKYAWDYD